jgi:SAM-dependent methyltransferase
MRLISHAVRFLPEAARSRILPAYRAYRAWQARHSIFFCPVCENKVLGFSPLPAFYWKQLAQYGSDLRIEDSETCNYKGYSCPLCDASDRDRLYALYLDKRLGKMSLGSFRMLDIAPAMALSQHIRRRYRIEYRTADLYMPSVDDRLDITRMDSYANDSFDAFICSHVLEHIPDDRAAMSELFRILKHGGWGIVMVPISISMREIREDPTKTTEAERWKYFGQNDHVRVYTRTGFLERLHETGFKTLILGSEFFGEETFAKCGVAQQSIVYLVEK